MKRTTILILLIFVSSCSDNTNPELLGAWKTEACEQAPEETGSLVGSWGKGIYEFTDNNIINYSIQLYEDSTCIEKGELIPIVNGDPIIFNDLGATTLQEGIEGHQFSLFVGATEPEPVEGFYTIVNSKLCFSDNINFNPFSITSAGSETSNIDFEKCLVK